MLTIDSISAQLVLGLFVALLCTVFSYGLSTGRSRVLFEFALGGTVVVASLLSGAFWAAGSLVAARAFVAFTDLPPAPVPWR